MDRNKLALDTSGSWTFADSAAANSEGWDLFDCYGATSNGSPQLQKIDDPQEWQRCSGVAPAHEWGDDTEVWLFVRDTPSTLHRKALDALRRDNPGEYEAVMAWAATS